LSRLCKDLPLVIMRGPTQCTNCIKHNADNKLDSWTLQNCSAHLNPNESQGDAYEPTTVKEKGMLGYKNCLHCYRQQSTSFRQLLQIKPVSECSFLSYKQTWLTGQFCSNVYRYESRINNKVQLFTGASSSMSNMFGRSFDACCRVDNGMVQNIITLTSLAPHTTQCTPTSSQDMNNTYSTTSPISLSRY
jgi:hypothetical protein